jgi:RimJ/RimL family protein N-acetyltransferase/ADP-ribose pyrophosphatase YjhB (NUDIX family)
MAEPSCVGALIRDEHNRVYVHRRSPDRRLLPGVWDVVGGHLEPGESPEQALAREIEEETGWTLDRIEAVIAEWEWDVDERHSADPATRFRRYERDYLVEVQGVLAAPRLEASKHDAFAWVGPDMLDLMMVGRTDGDRRLRDIVAKAVRTRLTERLRLEPIGPEHVADLVRLHSEPAIAQWHGGVWDDETTAQRAAVKWRAWEAYGAAKWMAYDRVTGYLIGRGGVDRMAADWAMTRQIADVLPGRGWLADRLEVGWTVATAKQGNGYATELGRAGLEFAFGDLAASQVVAFTERHNVASLAVMERLGMEHVAEIAAVQDGRLPVAGPVEVYRLTHDQYHDRPD